MLHALDTYLQGFTWGDFLAIGWPQVYELGVYHLPDGALGRCSCSLAHALRSCLAKEANYQRDQGDNEQNDDLRGLQGTLE